MDGEQSPRFDTFANEQVAVVDNFDALISTPLIGSVNAICWRRTLTGDFGEVARALATRDIEEPIVALDETVLLGLALSRSGKKAVEEMLWDLRLLKERELLPELNFIRAYPREQQPGVVPLDVYSFHADSATVPTDTYLCTYFGQSSEAVRNDEVARYIDRPEVRAALRAEFGAGSDEAFNDYLRDAGYDLHYSANAGARPFSFGVGNLWKIATDYPGNLAAPCIHRAPTTSTNDLPRLLLIS